MPFKKLVGVTSVRTQADYAQASATIEALLDEVGDDESHPLADVLDYLANQVRTYEDETFHIPQAEPSEVLRFLALPLPGGGDSLLPPFQGEGWDGGAACNK